MRPIPRLATAAVAAAVVFAAACNASRESDESRATGADAAAPDMAAPAPGSAPGRTRMEGMKGGRGVAGGAASASVAPGPPPVPGQGQTQADLAQPSIAPAMLIRTGEATIEVRQLDTAIAQVRRIAASLGGFVGDEQLQGGREQVRSAVIQLKIPAARFDQAVHGLGAIGRVEHVNVSAQDVGEEYTDVSARMANARRLEARLLELLERRTGKLEEVLAVERELSRVRQEIEVAEGRLRYLRTRAAVSTLTVTVHEPHPVVGGPGASPIAEAFRDAWRNFVGFVAGLIASLGWLVPLGAIALGALWLARRFGFGWKRNPPTH